MDSVVVLYMWQLINYERLIMHVCLTLILLMWTIWRAPTNVSKWRMGYNSAFKGLIRTANLFICGASDGDDLQKAPKCAAANFTKCTYVHAFRQFVRLNSYVGRETNKVFCSGGRFPGRETFDSVRIPTTALCVISLSVRRYLTFVVESLVDLSCPSILYTQTFQDPGHYKQLNFVIFFWAL